MLDKVVKTMETHRRAGARADKLVDRARGQGRKAEPELFAVLGDVNVFVSGTAVRLLAELDPDRDPQPIVEASSIRRTLRDSGHESLPAQLSEAAEYAVLGYARFHRLPGQDVYHRALAIADAGEQISALLGLPDLPTTDSARAAAALLDSPDPAVRLAAVQALRRLRPDGVLGEEELSRIDNRITDTDANVRRTTIEALIPGLRRVPGSSCYVW